MKKNTTYSLTVIADMFNKKVFIFATAADGPTTPELKGRNKKIDITMMTTFSLSQPF